MYRAVVERDVSYEGIFVLGVRTTGIFCRPGCSARQPRRANVEFFATAGEALRAGYRPCRRCEPLRARGTAPEWIEGLLEALEADPSRNWTDDELRSDGLDPVRVRRWFKRHRGMTFHEYQRSRRLGLALERIREGDDIMDAAFDHGYESLSGFRDAFTRLFGEPPGRSPGRHVVMTPLASPLGPLLAGADADGVCLLEFADADGLADHVRRARRAFDCPVVPGSSPLLDQLEEELAEYFAGDREQFEVPLTISGTGFQERVWQALTEIPYGETRSYADVAAAIDQPGAVRAVGSANGANRIPILIPCHRVVRSDGSLGGYGGELWRKRRLLQLEGHERWAEAERELPLSG